MTIKVVFVCVFVSLFVVALGGWMGNDDEKVLLRDVSAITLYPNRMTTGRRGSPVSQIKCVGGTAGCSKFTPSVVQCRNVGSDGFDVQWECKADMDDSYRFGKIQVSCEGYNHPNDPYVLKGSCGLEYTLDLTEAGEKRHHNSWNSYYQPSKQYSKGGGGSWFIFFLIVFAIVFLIRKMTSQNDDGDSPRRRPSPSRPPYPSSQSNPSTPPSYGFKPEYTREPPSYQEATTPTGEPNYQSSYAGTQTRTGTRNANASPFGGFWSGMGVGGLAGYLFGSRNNHHGGYGNGYGGYGGYGNGWGSRRGWGGSSGGWGGGSSWSSSSSSSSRSSSSSPGSSRTASGFGGTTRR